MVDDIMLMGKNPNYLGSWDLYDVSGNTITVSIKDIRDEQIVNNGQKEICTVCYFNENVKPMILNLTNKKMLSKLHHTKKISQLKDKYITIGYEKVKAFGKVHDALRIKPIIPTRTNVTEPEIMCEMCGKPICAASGMTISQMAEYTKTKYKKALCRTCAAQMYKETEKDKEKETEHENNEN